MKNNVDTEFRSEMVEISRRHDRELFGIDLSKLSVEDRERVKQATVRRWELEALKESRIDPSTLSDVEKLEARRMRILEAKFSKIRGERSLKELPNSDLRKQLKTLRQMSEGVR